MMRAFVASLLLAASAVAQDVGRVRAMTVTEDDLMFKDAVACVVTESVPAARVVEAVGRRVAPVTTAKQLAGVTGALSSVPVAAGARRIVSSADGVMGVTRAECVVPEAGSSEAGAEAPITARMPAVEQLRSGPVALPCAPVVGEVVAASEAPFPASAAAGVRVEELLAWVDAVGAASAESHRTLDAERVSEAPVAAFRTPDVETLPEVKAEPLMSRVDAVGGIRSEPGLPGVRLAIGAVAMGRPVAPPAALRPRASDPGVEVDPLLSIVEIDVWADGPVGELGRQARAAYGRGDLAEFRRLAVKYWGALSGAVHRREVHVETKEADAFRGRVRPEKATAPDAGSTR